MHVFLLNMINDIISLAPPKQNTEDKCSFFGARDINPGEGGKVLDHSRFGIQTRFSNLREDYSLEKQLCLEIVAFYYIIVDIPKTCKQHMSCWR